MNTRTLFLPEQGQRALQEDRCPYCDGWLEGMQFTQEDGRVGGLAECEICQLRFAWIDNPFECEIQEEGSGLNDCPLCGSSLHVDTGTVADVLDGLRSEAVYFCTACGYDSERLPHEP